MSNARDVLIKECIDVSIASKVPMLFLSNPGFGKTTAVKCYAEANNYAYVELEGSQNTKEDITGMYAINEGKLVFLEPEWYTSMCKAAKKRDVILFVDELSATSTEVQAALLKVIFEHKLKEGYDFPKNVTIIAAANYEENLPDGFGLIGPQLNRFSVISLDNKKTSTALALIEQMDSTEDQVDWKAKTGDIDFSGESYDAYVKKLQRELSNIVQNFKGTNDDYAMNFESITSKRFGMMTTRTLGYLKRALYAGVNIKASEVTLRKITDGLIGAGFNFDDEKAQVWRKALHCMNVYDVTGFSGKLDNGSLYDALKGAFPKEIATLSPDTWINQKVSDVFEGMTKSQMSEVVFMLQGIVDNQQNSNWYNLLVKACAYSNKIFGTFFMTRNARGENVKAEMRADVDLNIYIITKVENQPHVATVIYSESESLAVGQVVYDIDNL